jgi:hypothetical protein
MPGKLVTISSYENPTEAHAAKNLLEMEGITAYVADEAVGNWLGYMGTAIGGIKLQVASADAERCVAILARAEAEAAEADLGDPWRCNRCRETVDAGFEVCWSCGGAREEFQDQTFDPRQAVDADGADGEEDSWDEDDRDVRAPKSTGEMVDGRPNPYYAGSLPAESVMPKDMMARPASEEVEAMATRAWRAAILGILICPMFLLLNMYSVWLLLRVTVSGEELSAAGVWRYRLAWGVNLMAVFVMLFIYSAVSGMWDV